MKLAQAFLIIIVTLNAPLADKAQAFTFEAKNQNATSLGKGFDLSKITLQNRCTRGENIWQPQEFIKLKSFYNNSFKELVRKTHGKLSVNVNLGIIGISSDTDFFARNKSREQNITVIWHAYYQEGIMYIIDPELNQLGEWALQQDHHSFYRKCGQGFLSSAWVGHKLFIAARMQFSSVEDKRQFLQKLGMSFLFGLIEKKWENKKEWFKLHKKALLHIETKSIGSLSNANSMIWNQKYTCDYNNISSCIDHLQTAHSSLTDRKQYISEKSLHSKNALMFKVRAYEDLGLAIDSTQMIDHKLNALQKIQKQKHKLMENLQDLEYRFYFEMTDNLLDKIKTIKEKIKSLNELKKKCLQSSHC